MRTLVNFILDKSGSMASVTSDTIGGFNSYLDQLQKDKDSEYLFSLTMFDTVFTPVSITKAIADIKPLDEKSYIPGGCTALLDAIGVTVRKVEESKPQVDKILTVIMTDGHENSSHEHTTDGIKDLIKNYEAKGNWTFVFLGATPDAWDVGLGLGVQFSNTYRYDPNQSAHVYAGLAQATSCFARSAARATSNFMPGHYAGISGNPNVPRPVRPRPATVQAPKPRTGEKYKSGIWRPKSA
jgi:uncharacterized protein YegL